MKIPSLKSISWRFAEFYYNRGLWRLHTRTCIIMQETINRFSCPLIVSLKSKIHQLNLKDVIELNRNLLKIVAGLYECKTIQLLLYGTDSKNF